MVQSIVENFKPWKWHSYQLLSQILLRLVSKSDVYTGYIKHNNIFLLQPVVSIWWGCVKTLRPKLRWFRSTTSFPPKKHCYNVKKNMETICAAKLRPASGVCDASKARAPRFGPAASSSWCDWNFGIIHNICSSINAVELFNWQKWG